MLGSSLDTTWYKPNCFADPLKAMRGARYVETVREMSEINWFINLIGIILFRHPGIDGRVVFTMGLEKFGCELVSCIEMAHTVVPFASFCDGGDDTSCSVQMMVSVSVLITTTS